MSNAYHGQRLWQTWTRYVLLLFSLILFTGPITFGADTGDEPQIAPMNSQLSTDGDLFESPLSDELTLETNNQINDSTPLPSSYDLRTTGKLTPIKNQGNAATCWTFAVCGAMESCLLPTETRDFSENNLMNKHGYDRDPQDGNDFYLAIAYLTRWGGPVTEEDDPYGESGQPSPTGGSYPIVQKHVQEVLRLPDRNKTEIKKAIMTYGGVATGMVINPDYVDFMFNADTAAYWNYFTDDWSSHTKLNHAAVIVGWDDNYSRNNFFRCLGITYGGTYFPAGYPAGDGAWIVRDSRGSDWGDGGYFYVSYYDNNFARSLWLFSKIEPVDNYQRKYDYDMLGNVTNLGYSATNTAWMANVFNAYDNEPLTAVGTYAQTPNTTYTIQIYTNVDNGSSSPKNGSPVSTQSGTFTYAGYHTVTLNTPVALTAGQNFSVVIKLTTPGYNYPIPVEAKVNGFTSRARSEGPSYISKDGTTWRDMSGLTGVLKDNLHDFSGSTVTICNACIKAYISYAPVITAQPVSQTVDSEANVTITAGVFSMVDTTYQWYFKDMPIPDANSATLTLTNVSTDNNGEYYLTATNTWGTKTTAKATLTVRQLLLEPRVDLASGTYTSPQNVSVFNSPDQVPGVTVRYTVNGSDPTATSPIFGTTTPLKIGGHTVLKLRAFKAGYTPSHVVTAEYFITGIVAKPTFDLPSGTITKDQIHLSCTTSGASIYYTLDGSEPTQASLLYSGAILTADFTQNPTTIKAKAFKADWDNSLTAIATYYVSKIAPPTYSVAAGAYATARSVTIKSTVVGATIYYTTNGSDPNPTTGKKFTTTISITKDCTLKAVAYKSGLNTSEVATAKYYIGTTPAPKFSLASGGSYTSDKTVAITDSNTNAKIYYTTDGTTPTNNSTLYEQPISLNKNMIIKARAYIADPGTGAIIKVPSAVVSAIYNVYFLQPKIKVTGQQTITISCEVPDAVIRYTTNGSEPTTKSSTIVSGKSIHVGTSATIKAKTFMTGWAPSQTATYTYKITTSGTVATPTLSPAGTTPLSGFPATVTVRCTTPNADLFYTDDGTTPNIKSKLVENGTITVDSPKTIKVRAYKEGMAASSVGTATFTAALPTPTLTYDGTGNEQTVTLSSTVDGVTIRYTTDGTEPTATSKIAVNGQVLINKTMTLKAKAFKSGWVASKTLIQKFSITQVASPTFSVGSGTYQKTQAVVVKCATVPATGKKIVIHYTLDGTNPTATSSPTCAPGGTVTISATNAEKTVILKAIAIESGTTMAGSHITTATYHMTGTLPTPTFYYVTSNNLQASATYASTLRIYIGHIMVEGEAVHYTTDGTTPTLASPLMNDNYILVEKSCTLKVRAFKTDWLPSAVASETYSILQVAKPAISITDDGYATISCATPGAVIHYTINGDNPCQSDPVADGLVNQKLDSNSVIKAKAWKTGLTPSQVAFAKTQYTLTVVDDTHGTATPSMPVTVKHGVATLINAAPYSNYHFAKWTQIDGAGTVVLGNSSGASTTVTVTGGDVTIRANFTVNNYQAQWAKLSAEPGDYRDITTDSAGNVYILRNHKIVKYNSSGESLWTKTGFDGITCDASGNLYTVGSVQMPNDDSNSYTAIIVKYNSSGEVIWEKMLDSQPDVHCEIGYLSVACDIQGNIYAVGSFASTETGTYDFGNGVTITDPSPGNRKTLIVKYNSSGTAQWAKTLNRLEGDSFAYYYDVACDKSGNIYAVGYIVDNSYDGVNENPFVLGNNVTILSHNRENLLITKYDSSGNAQWAKTQASGGGAGFFHVACDNDGNAYTVGIVYPDSPCDFGNGVSIPVNSNTALIKYNAEGTAQWAKTFSPIGGTSSFNGVACDDYGNVCVVGMISGGGTVDFGNGVTAFGFANQTPVIVSYSTAGVTEWARAPHQEPEGAWADFQDVACDSQGNIYAIGGIDAGTYEFANVNVTATASGGWIVKFGYR